MNPDMLAALQGGAGAGGGMPEDMLAQLGGGGGDPGAEEEPAGALHGGGSAPGDPEELYRSALDALEAGMKADVDEQRINTVLQCVAKIQGELANSQKGMDGMMGGKMDPAQMRRMGAAEQAY